jgi:hypothetical protein
MLYVNPSGFLEFVASYDTYGLQLTKTLKFKNKYGVHVVVTLLVSS